MAASPAMISPPPPPPQTSSPDGGDSEYEYEEIEEEVEVEEEIEVEEEVSEAEAEAGGEGSGVEIGEDLTSLRGEIRENDTNQIMELKEPEEHIRPGSVTEGVSVSNPLTDIPTIQKWIDEVKTSEYGGKEELNAKGERTCGDNGPMAPLHDNGQVNHAAKTPLSGDSTSAPPVTDDASREELNAVASFKVETNDNIVEAVPNLTQISPRLHLPQTRSRDPFSSSEFDGEKKKMKIACEFHAKGWCIKGNSCRFLHPKDGVDAALKKGEALERQASSSACMPPQESGVHSTNSDANKVVLRKDDMLGNTPLHASRESIGQNSLYLPYSISRQRFSFGSSSWNNDAFGTQNLVERGLERRPSVSSDDWEPSVPFRPSHAITCKLLKDCLLDPIRDGMEQAGVRGGRLIFSHSDQGSSVKDVNVQSNSPEEEEKLLNCVDVGDIVKDNILSSSCDNKVELDKPKHKTELNVDGSGNNKENDCDSRRDGHMQMESKVFKCFQSALIEFVKELLKPTWRSGTLSKDAHKLIVKKSVDKVLSTLLPQQIPSTGESIKLYLSSSEPKLAKLVEAYIEKYGKS